MTTKLLSTLAGGLVMLGWLAAPATVTADEPSSRALATDQVVQARDDTDTVPIQFVDHRRHRHHHGHHRHHSGFSVEIGSPGYYYPYSYGYYEYPTYYYPPARRYYYPDYGYRSYYYDPNYGVRFYYRW